MKKATTFVCMMALCAAMTACGKDNNATENNTQVQTQEGTESQVVENTEMSQETGAASEETATDEVASEEELTGWSEEMENIKKAVTDALGENYWPNTAIPAEMLEGSFGITADMYDDYMAEMPMISTNVDMLIVVKPKEGQLQAVEEALNAYRDMMVEDTMQYPMNVGKIQASRIERIGDYVCFVQLGADVMNVLEQGDEAVIKHCLEQNELAIEVMTSAVVK